MLSIFDIFKIGIGPSSSHTFGPMVAGNIFINELKKNNLLNKVDNIKIDLYGSLALTGEGHYTDLAIELGLENFIPENVSSTILDKEIKRIKKEKTLNLGGVKKIKYERNKNLIFNKKKQLDFHSNALKITVLNKKNILFEKTYYSIGGGFVLSDSDISKKTKKKSVKLKYNFSSFNELMNICNKEKISINDLVFENEKVFNDSKTIEKKINQVVNIMFETIDNGLNKKGKLSDKLNLDRRSYNLIKKKNAKSFLNVFDLVSAWAISYAEENASFGRVITAPTNGASAIIPAVLKYFKEFYPEKWNIKNIKKFIFSSGIVGILCKLNASISGAECGCQAEIGVATAMASAGLTSALGGTNNQIENSAIIGLVHNLGLTCDPIAGLVMIPCIERNAINAIKAITASNIALKEDKSQLLKLDDVIKTLYETGKDMNYKYRETSLGGLAKNCCLKCCGFLKNN